MNQDEFMYILESVRKIFQDTIKNDKGIMPISVYISLNPIGRDNIMREMKQLGFSIKQYKSKPDDIYIERNKNKDIEEAEVIVENELEEV